MSRPPPRWISLPQRSKAPPTWAAGAPGGIRRCPFFAGKRRRLADGAWRASPASSSPSALPDAPAQQSLVTLESLQRSLEDLRISVLRNCKWGSPSSNMWVCSGSPFPRPPPPLLPTAPPDSPRLPPSAVGAVHRQVEALEKRIHTLERWRAETEGRQQLPQP